MHTGSSVGLCRRCNGRNVSCNMVSARSAANMTSKEVVMLYDLEQAQQLLSGAVLEDLSESRLSVEPADQPGKIFSL